MKTPDALRGGCEAPSVPVTGAAGGDEEEGGAGSSGGKDKESGDPVFAGLSMDVSGRSWAFPPLPASREAA